MDRGPIPLNAHAALEPLIALVIAAAPWIFGFSEVDSATIICVVVGVVMLVAGAMTNWRLSLVRLIPLRAHLTTDLMLGAVLILSPFVFGFSDEGGATRFTIIAGVLELMTALATRWDPVEAEPTYSRDRGTPATR
jgi:SPW repeat